MKAESVQLSLTVLPLCLRDYVVGQDSFFTTESGRYAEKPEKTKPILRAFPRRFSSVRRQRTTEIPRQESLYFESLLLTKAIRLLSGDHEGTLIVP